MQAFGYINSRRLQSSQYGAGSLPTPPTNTCSSVHASLWLALRASVLRRAACSPGTALRRSATSWSAALRRHGIQVTDSVTAKRKSVPSKHCPTKYKGLRATVRERCPLKIQTSHAPGSLTVGAFCIKPKQFTHHQVCAVPANHSLNRTYCGGPAFGLQKPSPNTSPPQ